MGEHKIKAVIPAAGLGTRFLPATKAMPKEMLPVVDKPAIQYVVEEATDAGIDSCFPRFAADLFEEGVAQGFGQQEVSALIKVLRARNGATQ